MLNCVEEPSSLGVAMPRVLEYAAIGPVAPVLPQLPQVSHGDSSTWSSTVLLGVVPGVGEGTGLGAGVGVGLGAEFGAGTTPAVVAELFPPQDTSANVKTRMVKGRNREQE